MIFKAKFSQILCIFAIFLLPNFSSSVPKKAKTVPAKGFNKEIDAFGSRLYSKLAKSHGNKNIVFSPFSIHTILSIVEMGATGNTANEMKRGLGLAKLDSKLLANYYYNILKGYKDSSVFEIANKIYVQEKCKVQKDFNDLVTKKFFSSVEPINFANSENAAQTINSWVEDKTNQNIKNLIDSDSLDQSTAVVLVNAIHFAAGWVNNFPEENTRSENFYLNEKSKFKVQMMHNQGRFRYGDFPELDATALEMKYEGSDHSMLILLPNSGSSLADLEKKLPTIRLSKLTRNMTSAKVNVGIPKFKAEFQIELSNILKSMGMKRMFLNAEFGNMLEDNPDIKVSDVVHKAVIEVNEQGTEAAAATAVRVDFLISDLSSNPSKPKEFIANRPFWYVIKNKMNLPIFTGSIKAKF